MHPADNHQLARSEENHKPDTISIFAFVCPLVQLLDEPDWDIFYWCTQRKPVPDRWAESFKIQGKLGHRLIIHTKNEEKAVRSMPDL